MKDVKPLKVSIKLFCVIVMQTGFSFAESFHFPEQPKNLKECYQYGQQWIRAQMGAPKNSIQAKASEFNSALSLCTWRAPEASQFRMPEGKGVLGPKEWNPLVQTPQGDWIIASDLDFRIGSGLYRKFSKNGEVTNYEGPGLSQSFLFGFDFAAYDLNKNTRAFGVQTANITSDGTVLSFALLAQKNGDSVIALQTTSESLIKSGQKAPVLRKCIYIVGKNGSEFNFADVTEKCRNFEVQSMADFQDSTKQKPLADSKTLYRWKDIRYEEEFSEGANSKDAGDKTVSPKLVIETKRSESEVKSMGPLKYKIVQETKKVKMATAGKVEKSWPEFIQGLNPNAEKKISKGLLKQLDSVDEFVGPGYSGENPNKFVYGESEVSIKIYELQKNVLSFKVKTEEANPLNRPFQTVRYISYDLATGDQFKIEDSFVSPTAAHKFKYWAHTFARSEVTYSFPDIIELTSEHGKYVSDFSFVPKENGLELINMSESRGYISELVSAVIPYEKIPGAWVKKDSLLAKLIGKSLSELPKPPPEGKPILKPVFKCQGSEHHFGSQKSICDHKMEKKYLELLILLQVRLESDGSDKNRERVTKSHEELMADIATGVNEPVADIPSWIEKKIDDVFEEYQRN